MRTSVLYNLALVLSASLANAQYTTSPPGPSTEPETTPQLEAATRRPCAAEGAAGGEDADALQRAWCPPCVHAVCALQWETVTLLKDAARQLQEQLQLHDTATRALLQQIQQDNDATRALLQQIQQENDASRALLDKRLQQIEQTQQKDQAIPALLDDRLKRMEERMRVLSGEMNLTAQKNGEASAEMKPLINQLDKRLINLEANVQRVLQQLPSSESKPSIVTSPPTCNPASVPSSTSTSLPSSAPSAIPSSATSLPSSTSISFLPSFPTTLPSSTAKSTPLTSLLGEELWRAAEEGSVERVRSLLDAGVDVNYRGYAERSPLMVALQRKATKAPCNEAVVSLLLQRGALVGAVDNRGVTALHFAAAYDTGARCVALLLGAGAHVDARDTWKRTPLFVAAGNNNTATVRALLGAGADANAREENGATSLHNAAYHGNEEIARALLAAGARKDLRTWDEPRKGKTPFDVVPFYTTYDPLRTLLRP